MITIIVPVYQSEQTLKRCVDSLRAQSYAEIEILLVIDGSPDHSQQVAEELAREDQRIRVIVQENAGASGARNRGLQEACGDYVIFIDSDDYVEKTLCEKMWLAIAEYNADLAVCGYHHLYFGKDVVKLPGAKQFRVREDKESMLELYRRQFFNMPWNKLYRRELIQKWFREDMDLGEDLLFNLEYIKSCESVILVEEPLIYYIQDGRGTTLSTKKRENRMQNAKYLYEQLCAGFGELYGEPEVETARTGCTEIGKTEVEKIEIGQPEIEKTETGQIKTGKREISKNFDSGGMLETRLVEELLDEAESLAFANGMSVLQKRNLLGSYEKTFASFLKRNDISVSLLDYKMLLFCLRRRWLWLNLLLVELRGVLVKLLRRQG